jgi:hypothetical protein
MSATGLAVFDRTLQETNLWLKELMARLGTDDRTPNDFELGHCGPWPQRRLHRVGENIDVVQQLILASPRPHFRCGHDSPLLVVSPECVRQPSLGALSPCQVVPAGNTVFLVVEFEVAVGAQVPADAARQVNIRRGGDNRAALLLVPMMRFSAWSAFSASSLWRTRFRISALLDTRHVPLSVRIPAGCLSAIRRQAGQMYGAPPGAEAHCHRPP